MNDGALVEEFMLGNTKIQIYNDAYIDKSKEDIEKVIRNVESIGRRILIRKAMEVELREEGQTNE